ncbi:NADPH-dependent FMN reductase [Paucilactobacillus nenjiangensis]|jgi:NAD(P)H-dependent FMN reductase|uniref:NAD(P)H-dependent oxidoreductase n=1 Tax=Paucilactobacillus nenjiangensis TaxID=1296540 RepID=A0A5P1WXQ4_9LACO|nr:NADPH-dependent FMN reductase [Paucilactobacillus nenjiangensis]QER66432.1 NAD(P)H-dependent oxidoreductase [Paucilactobacillus nenjiangensis]
MKKYIAIVGSNSKLSTNRRLLEYMKKRYKDDVEIELVEVAGLPIFKKTVEMTVPQQAKDMAEKITAADGVIIATPEYDHAIPAILSSALAWLSYGIQPLLDKPVLITGASFGNLGASRAQAQLRQILDSPEIKARVMPSSEFLLSNSLKAFNNDGFLIDETQAKWLDSLFVDFDEFIDISAQLNHTHDDDAAKMSSFSWDEGSNSGEVK